MDQRIRLMMIICTVVLITAICCHGIIAWLGIETTFGSYWVAGAGEGTPSAFMAGSSLAGDALSLEQIADRLGMRIGGWGVAGSSPSEWEHFQSRDRQAKLTILVVSAYDLNEYFLCDFRAQVVPLGQTVKDLWQSRVDWPFVERLLGLYPLAYVRIFFPTVGRSNGVMVGVREWLKRLLITTYHMESEPGPTMSSNESGANLEYKTEKISNWPPDRMLRRLAAMRSACQGKYAFIGPKRLAFVRMLREAREHGRVLVVILPVSPAYTKEFLSPEVKGEFEKALAELQQDVPQAHWIRLDQMDELNSNEYFWDLVHMNTHGQQIATKAFLGQLTHSSSLL